MSSGKQMVLLAALCLPFSASAIDFDEHPEVCGFMNRMVAEHNFKPSEVRRWLEKTDLRPDIVSAMERPREALPWHEYKKAFVTESQAERGAAYWRKHAPVLKRAADEYGVAPEVILAVMGIETQYGRNTGRFRVMDALATLAFAYPPRSAFFGKELEEYLLLARELDVDPLDGKGSYAGAIGIGQFMPSSYRAYAVDFDKSGKAELMTSHEDAIGSIANYLKQHGWRAGEPVIGHVRLRDGFDGELQSSELAATLTGKQLRGFGLIPAKAVAGEERVGVVRLEEVDGPVYRLGHHNFYVITRYNRSRHYAMAVYELSRMILERYLSLEGGQADAR